MVSLSYFNNTIRKSPVEIAEISRVVQENRNYARSLWGFNREQDVLDDVINHTIRKYDKSKGELRHYIIKLMKELPKNNKKLVPYDNDALSLKLLPSIDTNPVTSQDEFIEFQTDNMTEVLDCIKVLEDYIIDDFDFFSEKRKKLKKYDYRFILRKFEDRVIINSFEFIRKIIVPKISGFYNIKLPLLVKAGGFPINEVINTFSKDIEVIYSNNDIVVLDKNTSKKVYKFDLHYIARVIISDFYTKHPEYMLKFNGKTYYKAFRGIITDDINMLEVLFKEDLLYYFCKNLKMALLKKNADLDEKDIYYVFSKKDDITLNIAGVNYYFKLDEVYKKELDKENYVSR